MYQEPTIYNKTLTTAGTEYSQALPINTRKLLVKGRGNAGADIKFAFVAGDIAGGAFMTIPAGGAHAMDGVYLKDKTIYLVGTVNAEVCEILVWTD